MTDRYVKVLEQGKLIRRGVKARGRAVVANQDSNETLSYSVDWSGWLGSDTIASVTNTTTGITVSGASNTTTTAAFTLTSTRSGWLEHRITTAAGNIKELIVYLEVDGHPVADDYGVSWQVV